MYIIHLPVNHILISFRRARSRDEGGSATQRKDVDKSTEKAKKENPEAPDVVIGMQDERGGRGH